MFQLRIAPCCFLLEKPVAQRTNVLRERIDTCGKESETKREKARRKGWRNGASEGEVSWVVWASERAMKKEEEKRSHCAAHVTWGVKREVGTRNWEKARKIVSHIVVRCSYTMWKLRSYNVQR